MPSYTHYYQSLIPHMPVPPVSIHLHKNSPSVLTSLSGSQQQAESGSLRARSWCWTLSGRNHFLANSLTQRELLIGLTTCLFQQQSPPSPGVRSYIGSIKTCTSQQAMHIPSSAWPPQPTGKTNTGFPNRISNGARSHSVGSWERVTNNPRRE
jgi:hypothetical protein